MASLPTVHPLLIALLGLTCLSATHAARADTFMDQVAQINAAELRDSQVAQAHTQFDDTRTFARRMTDDHTALAQQLATLATQLQSPLPEDTLNPAAVKPQAAQAQVPSFDAAYAAAQVQAHERAVKLFADEARNATRPELQAFAVQNLPMMQHHLQMARRLSKTHRK